MSKFKQLVTKQHIIHQRFSLSSKPIKKLLKHYYPEQVSNDAVYLLRQLLETVAGEVSRRAVEEFKELNKRREAQGLPPKKRLDDYAVSRAIEKLFSKTGVIDVGLQSNQEASPGGER